MLYWAWWDLLVKCIVSRGRQFRPVYIGLMAGRSARTVNDTVRTQRGQKPVLRGEVGCACVAREVSVEKGGMGERGCARRLGGCGSRGGQASGDVVSRAIYPPLRVAHRLLRQTRFS